MEDPDQAIAAGRLLLGAALRARRLTAALTLEDIAAATELSLSYISNVERGHRLISLAALTVWASALHTTAADVLRDVYPFGTQARPTGSVQAVHDGRSALRSGSDQAD